jgi:hypothetical protein
VLGASAAIFLPQTACADLPNTVSDAEHFRKDQAFFYVPFLHHLKEKRREKQKLQSSA